MRADVYDFYGFVLTAQRAGCSKATIKDLLATVPPFIEVDPDDRKKGEARLRDASQERQEKANRARMECVGSDPFGYGAAARKKRVAKALAREERIKEPGTVFAPHDMTPEGREATIRRFNVEDAARAKGSSPPVDEDALDVEEDENAPGSSNNPHDLTSTKNTERFSFGRASRVEARATSAKTRRAR